MTARPVILVEHEDKAATIRELCGGRFDVAVLGGPPARVEFKISREGVFSRGHACVFSPAEGGQDEAAALLRGSASPVLLAFDPDLRGQNWSWLANGLAAGRWRLIYLAGLEEEEISRAASRPVQTEDVEAEANYLRSLFYQALVRHLQRLLGTTVGPGNLPLSYYTLVTLLLVDTKEKEIAAYEPPARWRVKLLPRLAGGFDSAFLRVAEGGEEQTFASEGEAGASAGRLAGQTLAVTRIERREISLAPPSPFTLAELVREAWVNLAMPPREVMLALRKMYYGVNVTGRRRGLVSNFLPGAPSVGQGIVASLRKAAATEFGAESLAVESGEAEWEFPSGSIVPLSPELVTDDLAGILETSEIGLYGLIRSRALASLMAEATGEAVTATLSAVGVTAEVHGRVIGRPGFLLAWREKGDAGLLAASGVAGLAKGDKVAVVSASADHSPLFSPEFYTVETLFADLADFFIRLDPLHLLMLQAMLDAGYLRLTTPDGCLRLLANCGQVLEIMNRAFPGMPGIALPAYLQQTVEEVTSGRKALDFAMKQFDQALTMHGKQLVKMSLAEQLRQRQQRSGSVIRTPVAEPAARPVAPMEEKDDAALRAEEQGKEEAAPEVEAIAETLAEEAPAQAIEAAADEEEWLSPTTEEEPAQELAAAAVLEEGEEEARPAPLSGPEQEAKTAAPSPEVVGLPEKEPAVAAAPSVPPPLLPAAPPAAAASVPIEEDFGPCPICGRGSVQTRKTPSGKGFFVCSNSACEFMAWSRPYPVPCGVCGSKFLVEKKDAAGTVHLRCPRAGCSYRQPLPEEEEDDAGDLPAPSGVISDSAASAAIAPAARKKVLVRRTGGAASGGQTRKVRVVRRKA